MRVRVRVLITAQNGIATVRALYVFNTNEDSGVKSCTSPVYGEEPLSRRYWSTVPVGTAVARLCVCAAGASSNLSDLELALIIAGAIVGGALLLAALAALVGGQKRDAPTPPLEQAPLYYVPSSRRAS